MPTHTLAFLPIQRKVRLVSCKRNTLPLCGSVIAITERGVLNGVMKNHGTSKRIHRCRSSVKKTMVKYYRAHISLLLFLGTYYLGIDVPNFQIRDQTNVCSDIDTQCEASDIDYCHNVITCCCKSCDGESEQRK